MSQKFEDKIAIIISWPREIDLYSNFLKASNENKIFDFVVNDITSIEKGRNKSNKLIQKLLENKKIKFKLLTDVYKKIKYKAVISTGEISAYRINLYSVMRFIYANSVGIFLHITKISKLLKFFFGRPFTAGAPNSIKIGVDWFPEKEIGNISIKFPDGADLKLRNYPDKMYEPAFDVFLSYSDLDLNLVKQKFKNKVCKKILYFRHENSNEENYKKNLIKDYDLDPQKKIIIWLPTHMNIKREEDKNILDWTEKVYFLKESYNFIVRPHPKSISRNNSTLKNLKKYNFLIDNDYDRNINKLIQCADIIIADYGAIIFEGIYMSKNLVLLDMFNGSKYVEELISNDAVEIGIRKELIFLKQNFNVTEIRSKIEQSLSIDYQNTIKKKKVEIFGDDNNKGLDYIEFINFLRKL